MTVVRILGVCCLCNIASHAQRVGALNGPNDSKGQAVTMELRKLEITDASLGLSYTIKNESDHEVWICSEVCVTSIPYEMYLTHDQQTLLIRRRLEVPTFKVWARPPAPGKYTRLRPGAVQPESLLIDLPARPTFLYAPQTTEVVAQTVRRVVLEIGYFDEDLPALLRSIRAVGDQFSNEGWKLYTARLNPDMWQTYFRGLRAHTAAGDFGIINKDPESKGYAYLNYSYQALIEKVLRMEINGVGIPYKGRIEPPAGASGNRGR